MLLKVSDFLPAAGGGVLSAAPGHARGVGVSKSHLLCEQLRRASSIWAKNAGDEHRLLDDAQNPICAGQVSPAIGKFPA